MPAVFAEKNTIWLVFDPPLRVFFCTHAFAVLPLATSAIGPFSVVKRRANARERSVRAAVAGRRGRQHCEQPHCPFPKQDENRNKKKKQNKTPGLLASNGALCAEPATQGK